MDLAQTQARIREFMSARDWNQFHSAENLAKSISIEAGELLESFQWNSEFDHESTKFELADVLTYCLLLADKLDVDPLNIVEEKLDITEQKYPVEKSRGTSKKYDQL
ncbi:MAG: nucleotide pyrophosphohydrolase [Brevibacterium aurantiacum]|uniref:Nucleotide pyrophosphohydrolase n=2 Tax=Brevibacterium aurantiacum TaxID=273384 RepID=A0A2A3X733_BREAU|nr:nucleotide pyrophosphohydrolase [Brevibacterium aurantiacum]MDN5607106.1 nucleotide pyrophosphohydrolase [Brevibacterium sp.]AZL05366.1 nucleotide pyrophosphohydrolase [Brevibacterium aurantiacum]AZL08950.1 nucleotide pyrophosphohydrolase [Brevibacterium aurantiacum]MDN6377564.1 nucleotide pyrophosphohydrolase [Brevibacterium aurantiacum]PCC19481.1 nucleotide pyrophosphohydrolase [Brevibacterium aurantiacum]